MSTVELLEKRARAREHKALQRANSRVFQCPRRHPYHLRPNGSRYCPLCSSVQSTTAWTQCAHGHWKPKASALCPQCGWYKVSPWLEELDRNGISCCPSGHELTHETLRYTKSKARKVRGTSRKCPFCFEATIAKGLASANAVNRAKRFCKHNHELTEENTYVQVRNGRNMRSCKMCRELARNPIGSEYVDWAVVLRLVQGFGFSDRRPYNRNSAGGPTYAEIACASHHINSRRKEPLGTEILGRHFKVNQATAWRALEWADDTGYQPLDLPGLLVASYSGQRSGSSSPRRSRTLISA